MNLYYTNGFGRPDKSDLDVVRVFQLRGYTGTDTPDKDISIIELSTPRSVQSIPLAQMSDHSIDDPIRLLAFWGRGWWNFRRFEHQYSSEGYRKPPDATSSTEGRHTARTLKMWSGAPVFGSIDNEFKIIGVHGNYLRGIANLFCAFDQQLHDEIEALSEGASPSSNIWRNTWVAPNIVV